MGEYQHVTNQLQLHTNNNMCYTKTYSLGALAAGWLSSLLVLWVSFRGRGSASNREQLRVVGVFFAYVSLMQLYDYIFWTQPAGGALNRRVTQLAILTNHTQPLVLLLCGWYFLRTPLPVSSSLTMLYTLAAIPYTLRALEVCTATTLSAESGTPNWEWNHLRGAGTLSTVTYGLFLASLLSVFWEGFRGPMRVLFSATTVGSFAFSWMKYRVHSSVGRFWCFFAAFAPLLGLFVSYAGRRKIAPSVTTTWGGGK